MKNISYDAHCHIFNLKYALKELKNILHDVLIGTYHFRKTDSKENTSDSESDSHKTDILETIKKIYELLRAALESEEKNMDFLQKNAEKVFPSETHKIIPLMMDIFYMFTDELNKDEDISFSKSRMPLTTPNDELERQWNEILDDFSQYIKSGKQKRLSVKDELAEDFETVLAIIENERNEDEHLQKNRMSKGYPFYQTKGFCYHMDNLKDLVKERKGELFPFVAIDPRREGIIDYLLTGAFFKGDSPFYGVKLYPRLGYHPLCKPMDKVFAYCSQNKIPIITHCGTKGFPPFDHWDFDDFGNPANFVPVLKKYPNLIIDFAHFGIDDETGQWVKTITELINNDMFPNVYTDLACYTSDEDLAVKATLINQNEKLKSRIMLGSDFDVVYFAGGDSMQDYYNKFKAHFSPEVLLTMRRDNPARFLAQKSITE